MHLLAILIALGAERWIGQYLHLRELRWLDTLFDWMIQQVKHRGTVWHIVGILSLLIVLTLPVWLASLALTGVLADIFYMLLAAAVLFFSLGPRDLFAECDQFNQAAEEDDFDAAEVSANAILEYSVLLNEVKPNQLASSVFTQSKNRIFSVLFWFIVLGPAGAWFVRVSDLLRRRLVFEVKRRADDEALQAMREHIRMLHGVVVWIPARLLALSFALVGSFDGAWQNLRDFYATSSKRFFEINDDVVACTGIGALGPGAQLDDVTPGQLPRLAQAVVRAKTLVWRTLFLWMAFLAVLIMTGAVR